MRSGVGVPEAQSVAIGGKSTKSKQRKTAKRGYLDGQMLIAMPSMGDDRFARSVIYVCAHSTEGAMGIIVNQLAANLTTQVRAIAEVATAVTKGDLTRSITVEALGEVAALKDNVNEMIGNLAETTRKNVSRSNTLLCYKRFWSPA